jgi:hypothetical protein
VTCSPPPLPLDERLAGARTSWSRHRTIALSARRPATSDPLLLSRSRIRLRPPHVLIGPPRGRPLVVEKANLSRGGANPRNSLSWPGRRTFQRGVSPGGPMVQGSRGNTRWTCSTKPSGAHHSGPGILRWPCRAHVDATPGGPFTHDQPTPTAEHGRYARTGPDRRPVPAHAHHTWHAAPGDGPWSFRRACVTVVARYTCFIVGWYLGLPARRLVVNASARCLAARADSGR